MVKKDNSDKVPSKEEVEEVFRKEMKREGKGEKSKDVVEIPIGNLMSKIKIDMFRENPWILSTVVLGIVLLVVLITGFGPGGDVANSSFVGEKVVSYINSNPSLSSEVSLVSAEKEGGLYKVTLLYEGQEVPVYTTLDGKYLVGNPVDLDSPIDNPGGSGQEQEVAVEAGDSPYKGALNAPVTIVEFTDYQCPYCGRHFEQTYPSIMKDYVETGKVRYVVKNFPLDFHPEAQKSAEAALCVRDQKGDSGYFGMHDKLFENQDSLSVDNYKEWARELGVNGDKFDDCLDSGKYEDVVKEDLTYGQQLGVSGTPGFFIGNEEGYVPVSGAQPYSVFKQVIDSKLNYN